MGKRENQEAFTAAYWGEAGCNKKKAASIAGVGYSTCLEWFREDPEFVERFELGYDNWADELERVAIERAKTKSDTLLIFMLKAHRPDRYDDNFRKQHLMQEVVDDLRPELQRVICEEIEQAQVEDPYSEH